MKNTSLPSGHELDRTCPDIADRAGDARAARRRYRAWHPALAARLLDHLLMPSLQRAFAFEQRRQITVAIPDDLHLDVAWVLDEFFDQHAVVAERRFGFPLGADDRSRKFAGRIHHAHAAPAAAGGRLHQHRKADLVGRFRQGRLVLGLAVIAGHQRHAGLFHQLFRAGFRAHRGHHRGCGTDEHQPGVGAGLGEFRVLRQKPVAGMHGLGARLAGHRDQPLDVEIAVARPRRPSNTASSARATCIASRSASE